MMEVGTAAHYFLSANTPQGYLSSLKNLYDARQGWKAIILTGGPDEKQTHILENTGKALISAGEDADYIYSCIDSEKLDAVAFPRIRTCLIDGNPPNQISADFPGIAEYFFDLGDCLDEKVLEAHRKNIFLFSARVENSSDRAYRFLSAAASLLSDICRLTLECTDTAKIESYASHIAHSEFPPTGNKGNETQRFINALTADGQKNLFENITSRYERIFEIDDDYGIGKLFLNKLRCSALSNGYDVISCSDPMFPDGKPEHLLIPSISLAFLTTTHNHPLPREGLRHIHIRRFIDREAFKLKRPRISFNRKASRELLDEARASRQMIWSYYSEALNQNEIEKQNKILVDKLLTLAGKI